MEFKRIDIGGGVCAEYADAGGAGRTLHLLHANGFNAGVYGPVFEGLTGDFRALGMNICREEVCAGPGGAGLAIKSWQDVGDELGRFIDAVAGGGPVVGVGHSIGAVATALCAVKRPELFSRIILLEPVLLEPKVTALIRLMRALGQTHKAPLAMRARRRRNGWADRAEALEYFRSRPLFEGWDEGCLRAYAERGLKESAGGGVELVCSPEVEAQGFQTYPPDIWRRMRGLRVPTLFVRGERSDTITPRARDLFLKVVPHADFIELPGAGHLFPMQRPAETARIIKEYAM